MLINKSTVLVVLLMLLAFANISSAATTYTAANVKGSYSLLLNGWNVPPGDESAGLGLLNFDGVSAVSGYITVISHGNLDVETISSGSTYSVASNGIGFMTLNIATPGGGTVQFAFVLNSVSGSIAKSLQFLFVDIGETDAHVQAGTASLINLSKPATASKLKGTYSLLMNWWAEGTQQGLIGTIVFDGKSKVTLSFTDQQGGQTATTGTASGSYSVNSDGSGSISLTFSNNTTMQLDFVMNSIAGSVAKGIQLIDVTDPSSTSVDTGSAVYE